LIMDSHRTFTFSKVLSVTDQKQITLTFRTLKLSTS